MSEEVLAKLNKRELTGMVLSLQSKDTEKKPNLILEQIRKLNHKFNELESVVVKQCSCKANKLFVIYTFS